MEEKTLKERYPILSLRMKPVEMDYIRREAAERNLTLAQYVRKVLVPFELPPSQTAK